MIDLDDKYLQEVLGILDELVPEYEVWAYGSRVNGSAKEFSDLDLVLIGNEPVDWRQLERLKDRFAESSLPITVDVSDWQSIPESFRAIVASKHEILRHAAS